MIRVSPSNLAFSMCLVISQMMIAPELSAKELKVLSEQTATGFGHLESVAYDPTDKVLYTSESSVPTSSRRIRTAKVRSPKVSLDGKILEDGFAGQGPNPQQAERHLDQR